MDRLDRMNSKGHRLFGHAGWNETGETPSDARQTEHTKLKKGPADRRAKYGYRFRVGLPAEAKWAEGIRWAQCNALNGPNGRFLIQPPSQRGLPCLNCYLLWSFQSLSRERGMLSTSSCTWKLDDLVGERHGQQAIQPFAKYFPR